MVTIINNNAPANQCNLGISACPDDQPANVHDPTRWGLPGEAMEGPGDRLQGIWERFRPCFKTKTRDTGAYARIYLQGLLILPDKRNYANMARRVIDVEDDGRNLQQFMSDSPWSARRVFEQIQVEIGQRPELSGGMLTSDESADKKAGDQSAGAARQWLGRFGKVDPGQVGVALGYYQQGTWAMVDAELYLPEVWFDQAHARLRRRWHIPAERRFLTKQAPGLEMIRRAEASGLPFEVVGCDSLYGQDRRFRADLDAEGILYMADIPCDTPVYPEKPVVGIPETPPGKKGRPFSRWRLLRQLKPVEVRQVATAADTIFQSVAIRHAERGLLVYECAARLIRTITPLGEVRQEWLLIRREHDGSFSFSLSNAPGDTPLSRLARWRGERYFAERIFQDAKSEGGWDELMARKYRAWMHHTALDALALWFIAETRPDWAKAHPRDPLLAHQLEVEALPALSMANPGELLQAVLPLKQLSRQQATDLVVKHLVDRSRSTRSRWKAQCQIFDSS